MTGCSKTSRSLGQLLDGREGFALPEQASAAIDRLMEWREQAVFVGDLDKHSVEPFCCHGVHLPETQAVAAAAAALLAVVALAVELVSVAAGSAAVNSSAPCNAVPIPDSDSKDCLRPCQQRSEEP